MFPKIKDLMYHCYFQGKSLVDDVAEVGFRSDSHLSSDSK